MYLSTVLNSNPLLYLTDDYPCSKVKPYYCSKTLICHHYQRVKYFYDFWCLNM